MLVASLAACTITVFADELHPHGYEWYIPKTCPSSPQETTSGDWTVFYFCPTKILNSSKRDVGYQRIRVKVYCKDAQWYPGAGFSSSGSVVLSGRNTSTMKFTLVKGIETEVYPVRKGYGSTSFKIYYYGNNPDLDAYATIKSSLG